MDDNFYGRQSSRPAENKPLNNLYGLLCSLIQSFTPDIIRLNLKDGSGERFNNYINELITMTSDGKLADFKIEIRPDHKGVKYVMGEAYVRQLSGVVNYLHRTNESIHYYCSGPPTVNFSRGNESGATFYNHLNAEQSQANDQVTTVNIEFTQTIISLTEVLTNLERDNPDIDSKENRFAAALKKHMPTAKSTLDIVALVLRIAGEVGLNPQTVLKMLNLT